MSKSFLGSLVGAWFFSASLGFGQISSFPPPPPLQPSPQENQPTPAPAAAPASNFGPAQETTAGGAAGAGGTIPGTATPPANAATIPVTAATLNSMSALDDKVGLNPGDHISFRVIEDRDEAVERIVTDTGEVDFPYVGRVKVQGKTCLNVATDLKKLLEVDYYKRATVIVGLDVIASHSNEVVHDLAWVVGQVRSIGPQELSKIQPITVSQAILRAGGFGDFADQRRVRVIHRAGATAAGPATTGDVPDGRGSDAGTVIDVKAVFDGQSNLDPVVKPNDLIIVPKRLVNF